MRLLKRLFGPPDIDRLKSKGDIDGLAAALRHKEPTIRTAAAAALGAIGAAAQAQKQAARLEKLMQAGDSVLPSRIEDACRGFVSSVSAALAPAVGDANPAVRRESVRALAPLRISTHARDGLIAALSDDQPIVRRMAAEALVAWNNEYGPAIEPLIARLQDDDVDVRVSAQATLEHWYKMNEQREAALARQVRAALLARQTRASAPAPEAADPASSMSDEEVRYVAAQLLAYYFVRPEGFVCGRGWREEREIRVIGESLDQRGGLDLMRRVHDQFRTRCTIPGAPRNLEFLWAGIGAWQG